MVFKGSLFLIFALINSHFQLFFWVFGSLIGKDIMDHLFVCFLQLRVCMLCFKFIVGFFSFFTSLENT